MRMNCSLVICRTDTGKGSKMLSLALMLALQGLIGSAYGMPSSSAVNDVRSSSPGFLRIAMIAQKLRLRNFKRSGAMEMPLIGCCGY